MLLKISLEITGINSIRKSIHIENCFCCTLDQINAILMSRRDYFKNIKNLTVQKHLTGSVYAACISE